MSPTDEKIRDMVEIVLFITSNGQQPVQLSPLLVLPL